MRKNIDTVLYSRHYRGRESRVGENLVSVVSSFDPNNLFQSLPEQLIVMKADDPDFTIIAQSDAHARIVGNNIADVVGKPVLVAFPDTSERYKKTKQSALIESFRRVITTKRVDAMPAIRYDLPDENGVYQERYWQLIHTPLFDKKGNIVAILQKNQEITEDFISEQRFQKVKDQLKETQAIGKIGSWVWDIKHNIITADEQFADMFGLDSKKASEGLPLAEFTKSIHPYDQERVSQKITEAIEKKISFEEEYRTIVEDGTRRWVLARGHVEYDENGEADTFPGVIIDITDRKTVEFNLDYLSKASLALSSSLKYKTTLQKVAKLAVPHIADWCTIDLLNEDGTELELVGLAHKDPEKVKWAEELRSKQGPPPLDTPTDVPNVIRTGKSQYYPLITDDTLVAVAKDKEELALLRSLGFTSVMIVPLSINGKTCGAITFISAELKRRYTKTDLEMAEDLARRASMAMTNAFLYSEAKLEIAERERLEEELRNMNEWLEQRVEERTIALRETNTNLERSNKELEDFAYVASHDLQEPLRKIQAFSNLLEEEYGEALEGGRDYLNRMRNAAARMSTLIEDLLQFSRVTTKGREFTSVDLDQVVKEVLNDLETRVNDTKATVVVDKMPKIDADALQMRQLFQNIIANALKFHKPDEPPHVEIRYTPMKKESQLPTRAQIEITDNGVGFDEKYLDRIFAVFQRLHGRDSYEGTGIGLAVCRKIVERHGGTIDARSRPNRGATFIITLPLKHIKGESR